MGTGRISTRDELDGRLAELRAAGGEPLDFELGVRGLAADLDKPLSGRALLRLALVGLEAYDDPPVAPSAEPVLFVGRPFDSMTVPAPTTDLLVPRERRVEGESQAEFGGYLAQHLLDWILDHGAARSGELERAVTGYVITLCRDDFRAAVPLGRTLDWHALGMLTAERTMRRHGGIRLTAAEEEAFFRWLHLTRYAEVPDEFLREQAARRAVRLQHDLQPAGEVAVLTCEVPVDGALSYDELITHLDGVALSAEQLRGTYRSLAERGSAGSERWAARSLGFEDTGRLDLTPAGAGRVDYKEYAHAHLLRWLVDNQVPVQPMRMQLAHSYARHVVGYLVEDLPEGRDRPAVIQAHHMSTYRIRRREEHLSLVDELLLLAWLLVQRSEVGVKLPGFLERRDLMLEQVAQHLSEERGQS